MKTCAHFYAQIHRMFTGAKNASTRSYRGNSNRYFMSNTFLWKRLTDLELITGFFYVYYDLL